MLHRPLLWILFCLLISAQMPAYADEPKTADDAIAKYLQAIGGREKLDACKSLRMSGTVALPDGRQGRFVQEHKRPNKFRGELSMPEGMTVVQAFDGQAGWGLWFGRVVELPPQIAKLLEEQADMDGPLVDYQKKGHQVELLGREEIDGRPAYKLKVIKKGTAEGDVEYHYLDAKSFLPVKVAVKRTIDGNPTEQERSLGDYKSVGGLLFAHSSREREGPAEGGTYVRTVEKIEINVDLPDERFSMAAAEKEVAVVEPSPAPVMENEPAARALYDQMIAALRAPQTLSFESQYQVAAGGVPIGRARYKIWLKKPNQFRMEGFQRDEKLGGVLIGDGQRSWLYWPNGRPMYNTEDRAEYQKTKSNSYMTKLTPQGRHSIGHEAGMLGVGIIMTILDLSTFHGYTDSLQPLIDAVAGRGTEKVGEEQCDVVEVSIMAGQRTWKIWLSQRDHLPRKLLETVRVSHEIVAEEAWTDISIDGEIADDLFAWTPPDGWKEWRLPTTESRLLKPGTPAPDFELMLADEKTFKLSDYRGKAVMLVFWRVGCPPCREEIVYLQKVHEKHADKGLVVLGFNSADQRKIALDLMRKHSLTFPTVLDSSPTASATALQKYHANAVPITYVIDRAGKIAMAWVGYQKDDPRVPEALKKLGFD